MVGVGLGRMSVAKLAAFTNSNAPSVLLCYVRADLNHGLVSNTAIEEGLRLTDECMYALVRSIFRQPCSQVRSSHSRSLLGLLMRAVKLSEHLLLSQSIGFGVLSDSDLQTYTAGY